MQTRFHCIAVIAAACLSVMAFTGCIKEDTDGCDTGYILRLKVVDAANGQDITATGEVASASLFLYDENRQFLRRIDMTGDEIRQRKGIDVELPRGSKAWISAWGNIHEDMLISGSTPGSMPDESVITIADPEQGYAPGSGNIFFGTKQIGAVTRRAATEEEIVITQKNARMHITVRGLTEESDHDLYYFRIVNNYDGYTLSGSPVHVPYAQVETGVYDRERGLLSGPFNLIHSEDDSQNQEQHPVTVYLYRKPSRSSAPDYRTDQLVASSSEDSGGNPIVLRRAMTTNVLIEIRESGSLGIRIEVTPWNVIYQWERWSFDQ